MSDIAFAELTKTVTALPYETVSDNKVMEVSDRLINQNLEAYRELAK